MEQKNKNEIKDQILLEIKKTEQSVMEFKEMSKPIAPDDAIGRISRMDAINNKSVAEASLRKNQDKLKQLNFMLNNIDDPEFGLCAKCMSPIPIGRILRMPQSRFCINCAV